MCLLSVLTCSDVYKIQAESEIGSECVPCAPSAFWVMAQNGNVIVKKLDDC